MDTIAPVHTDGRTYGWMFLNNPGQDSGLLFSSLDMFYYFYYLYYLLFVQLKPFQAFFFFPHSSHCPECIISYVLIRST